MAGIAKIALDRLPEAAPDGLQLGDTDGATGSGQPGTSHMAGATPVTREKPT